MVKVLPMVPSLEGHENFPEAVPVIAEIPLALPSSEGRGKLGTTGTTVWFMVEYCQVQHMFPITKVSVSDTSWHRLIVLVDRHNLTLDGPSDTYPSVSAIHCDLAGCN